MRYYIFAEIKKLRIVFGVFFELEKNGDIVDIILNCLINNYNEQKALLLFYKEATKVLEKLNYDYNLLVNDRLKKSYAGNHEINCAEV